ncbi:MAG: DUF4340 domain-containing protein [Akkermansiaceae bacterium]|jgi:hypothetical protein|nr:DUF4340 domain-containing protein [Akkermansiaceae bacterium]
MRSFIVTFLLAIAALLSTGLGVIGLSDARFSRLLGSPATAIGETLYDFDAGEVTDIYLFGNGVSAHCQRTRAGWQIKAPWEDRMDPRAVQKLLEFTLGTRVEGAIPADKIESTPLKLENGEITQRDGSIALRFAGRDDEPLAKFLLGNRSSWFGTDAESGEMIPTVFVQPRDRNRKDYVYACTDTSDIHKLLGNGFTRLRDHHPFLFHPTVVQSVRLRTREGEMLLSRDAANQLWSITKPLGLQADRERLVSLLQGLYDLEAVTVKNRDEVTLPAETDTALDQIALKFFGATQETILSLYPPATEDAKTILATVSDRPDTVFELPLVKTAAPDLKVALQDIPASVNDLRDPTLTNIDPRALRSILISPASGEDVLITRENAADRFKLLVGNQPQEPNETALFALLKTVTEGKVAEFVSDTATELEAYGLDHPFLILRFLGFDGTEARLDFGQGPEGKIFAIRSGTTTVVRIDPPMLQVIPLTLWEWRDTRLWRISPPDVIAVARAIGQEAPLELGYEFRSESWKAKVAGKDRSADLNTGRADILLDHLLNLRAGNWLRPRHSAAMAALANPTLRFEIICKTIDDEGNFSGIKSHRIALALVEIPSGGRVCYGLIEGVENPFIVDPSITDQLGVDLFAIE